MTSGAVAAADIGTSKVCVVIGQVTDAGIHVHGVGFAETGGRRGRRMNTTAVAAALNEALEAAESSAQMEARELYVGITTDAQRGENVVGDVRIAGGVVREQHVDQVLHDARERRQKKDRVVLHTLVQDFVVGSRMQLLDPVDRRGDRLRARVHLITASEELVSGLRTVSESCHLRISGVVAQPVASSFAVLEPEESRAGVVLIDIGARTTDVMMWFEGVLIHSVTFASGGDRISRAIAEKLGVKLAVAQRLKQEYGAAELSEVDALEQMTWTCPERGARVAMQRALLVEVMEAELVRLLEMVRAELQARDLLSSLTGGVVLCGGTSELPGLVGIAERVLGTTARIGVPPLATGLGQVVRQPRYAAALGLLRYVSGAEHPGLVYRLHEPTRWELFWEQARRVMDQFI